MAEATAAPPLFVGRSIPLVLCGAVLALAGVLAVDRFIEHRQIEASTTVAESTIATFRQVGTMAGVLDRYQEASSYAVPDVPSAAVALREARDRLVLEMHDFEEHVGPADRSTWQGLRESMAARPVDPGTTAASLRDQIGSLKDDLSTIATIAYRSGIADMRAAERQHTLHGALEAVVICLMAVISLALVFRWSREEARARASDARVEAQLRRTIADLDAFAGRLAHDLRAPLQPILIGSQTIERAAASDVVRAHAERIERSARRLGRMCDVLMQYARVSQAGAQEGASTRVNAEIHEVVAEFDEKVKTRGARIVTDLGSDFTLACPSEVVDSLVGNLVDNALKYGAKEGEAARVIVRTRAEDSWGVIEVEDEGPGVSPDLRQRVFEPLFRGQKGGEGIGLGLSIIQRLVELQRGHVELHAGAKGGALFRVLLPIASDG
jgi:signal transduction histidine kinase